MTAYQPRIKDFKEAVSHAFGVTPADLEGKSTSADHYVPRQVFCVLVREAYNVSMNRIGREVNRDHTTVRCALKRFPGYQADPIYGPQIEAAREALQGGIFRSCRGKPVDT